MSVYESENLSIKNQDEIDEELDAQIMRLKEKICDVLMEEQVRLEVALSIFATMYVKTAHDMMELPKEIALEAIKGTIDLHYADEDNGRGEVKWLN